MFQEEFIYSAETKSEVIKEAVIKMISDFAGHKDISTTQRYYIHSVKPLTEKADVFAKVSMSK